MRGWILVGVFMAMTAALAGVAVWAFLLQLGVPLTTALTGVGDIQLPLSMKLAMWLIFGGAIGVSVLTLILHYATLAVPSIPVLGEPDGAAIWTGVAVGAAAASPWYASEIGKAISIGIAALACLAAVVSIHRFISGVREGAAEVRRRDRLRTDGECAVAEITTVRFLHTWWLGGPEFEVDAIYHAEEGTRTVRGRLVTAPADAPVVGGTVIVRFDPDHPSDFLLDRDPDSIKEPGAAERYVSPDV